MPTDFSKPLYLEGSQKVYGALRRPDGSVYADEDGDFIVVAEGETEEYNPAPWRLEGFSNRPTWTATIRVNDLVVRAGVRGGESFAEVLPS